MRISVIIPVYNGGKFIQRCLDSVFAQSHQPAEIIVVDDGSNDETPSILAGYSSRIRLIQQENRGRSAARNAGMAAATGDYIAFLDADDCFLEHHLAQLAEAVEHTSADIAYDWIGDPFFKPDERLPRKPSGRHAYRHILNFQLIIVNSMVRRELVSRSNVRFDEDLSISEDALFYWKLIALGATVSFVRKRGTAIGIHGQNTTADVVETYRQSLKAYDRFCAFVMRAGLHNQRMLLRAAAKGAESTRFKMALAGFYCQQRGSGNTQWQEILRYATSRMPLRLIDRTRSVCAVLWLYCRLLHVYRIERLIFGYSVAQRRC